jgi:hypothetical protein
VDDKQKTFWKIFFLVEGCLLAIALILPVTPSKTGSDKSLAEYFLEDPSYLEQVLFSRIFINVIVVFLAVFVMIIQKVKIQKG